VGRRELREDERKQGVANLVCAWWFDQLCTEMTNYLMYDKNRGREFCIYNVERDFFNNSYLAILKGGTILFKLWDPCLYYCVRQSEILVCKCKKMTPST